jgi:hypothetical protein
MEKIPIDDDQRSSSVSECMIHYLSATKYIYKIMARWHTRQARTECNKVGDDPTSTLATQGPISNVMHIIYVRLHVELHIHTSPLSFS